MSRGVRKVPANWEHPKNEQGYYIPLHGGSFSKCAARWDEEAAQWKKGFRRHCMDDNKWEPKTADMTQTFAVWRGKRPDEKDYMPDWSDAERTHYQMYEYVTKGTPISPVKESPEALAHWLTDNNASADSYETATYEQWLALISHGYPSFFGLVILPGGEIVNGVEAISRLR